MKPESFLTRHQRFFEAAAKIGVAYGLLWFVWAPFFASDAVNDSRQDWSYGVEYKSYATTALFDYQEIPYFAWQGRHKGHRNRDFDTFFANPETPVLSPTLPLYRLLDYPSAVRAEVRIQLLVGVVGIYVLLAAWLSRVYLGTLLVFSLLYLGSGAVAGPTLAGHGNAGALFALPLAFGLYLQALQQTTPRFMKPSAIGCGALLALLAYAGASHLLLHFLLFFALYSLVVFALGGEKRQTIVDTFIGVCAIFFCLAAYKLLPMWDVYAAYRADYIEGYASLRELGSQFLHFTIWPSDDHEFDSYVGVVGAALLLIALFCWNRKTAPLLAVGLLFLVFTWLPVAEVLQRYVPFFTTQGVFSRFRVEFLFALLCVASWAVDRGIAWADGRSRGSMHYLVTGAAVLILVATALDLQYGNFELRRRELLNDPYPSLYAASMAPVPFASKSESVFVQPVRRGVNWAEYRYQVLGETGANPSFASRVLPRGPGHLVFSGDIRSEETATGFRLVATQTVGTFRYDFVHAAQEVGAWISGAAILFLAALGIVAAGRRRYRTTNAKSAAISP